MAGIAGSIHINSIVISLFLIFSFSSFSLVLFHPIICVDFIFAYLHMCRFAYFQKRSAHEQYAFRQEDVPENRRGMKRAMHFLSGTSVGGVAWVAGVAGSIHINSAALSLFLIFFFASLLLFLFHPIIFVYLYISYMHMCIFSKMQHT
jgi:hypothetical protein